MVWKLDRLSRSLSDLLRILERIDKTGASFKSLTETIDTSGPCGRLMMNMLGAFNQFEREIIKERTKLGLKRARANGRIGGGRFILSKTQQAAALQMVDYQGARKTAPRPLRSSQARTLPRTMWVYGPEPGLVSGFSGSTVPGAKLVEPPIISVMTLSRSRFKPAGSLGSLLPL
jgi:hypothetical protein